MEEGCCGSGTLVFIFVSEHVSSMDWYFGISKKKRDDESWFEVYKFENTGYRWSLLPCSMANAGTAAGVFFDDAIVP